MCRPVDRAVGDFTEWADGIRTSPAQLFVGFPVLQQVSCPLDGPLCQAIAQGAISPLLGGDMPGIMHIMLKQFLHLPAEFR